MINCCEMFEFQSEIFYLLFLLWNHFDDPLEHGKAKIPCHMWGIYCGEANNTTIPISYV